MSATPRVRVELVRGQSSLGAWETDAKAAGARVEVGADPECAWRVVASGVQPYHVELYWDGEVLWVAAGDDCSVKVDGMAIDDWCATAHGSRVEFGDAQLRVVTQAVDLSSVVDRTDHGLHNPSLVTRSTGILGEKTQLDPGGPRFADDAPPVYALDSGAPKAPSPEDQIVTRMNVSPKRRLDEVAIAKTAVDPPRQSQPIFGGAAASPNDTRLVPLPGGPRPAGAEPEPVRRAPPPRLGNRGRAVRASAPPKPNGAEAPGMNAAMAAPPAYPNAHAMQAQLSHAMPPSSPHASPHAMPPASPHAMPPAMPPHAMPPHAMPTVPLPLTAPLSPQQPMQTPMPMQAPMQASAFPNVPSDAGIVAAGAAPTPMQIGPALPPEAPSFTAPPAVVATAKPKKKMSLPPRTWIMLSVTVLAACFVLLMDDEEEVVVDQTPQVVQVAESPEIRAGTSETTMEEPEEPRSLIGLPDTIEVAEPEDPAEAVDTIEEETGDTLQRRAADALMNGDHRAAMLLYRELVLLEPENEAYRSIALMIERELRARCRDGVDPNGEPCEAP